MPRPNSQPPPRATVIIAALGFSLALFDGLHQADVLAADADTSDELQRVNQEIEETRSKGRALESEAKALSRELRDLRAELVTTAKTTQQREALVSALEQQIAQLERDQAARRRELAEKHGHLAGALGALTRLSMNPPQAFFLYPGTPIDAVRGSILLRAAVPALGDQAILLRDDLLALADVRADIDTKLTRLNQADADLAADRRRLEALIARKQAMFQDTARRSEEAAQRLETLVGESKSLKDLIERLKAENARLEAQRKAVEAAAAAAPEPPPEVSAEENRRTALLAKPDGLRDFPDDGEIAAPVAGQLIRRYGSDTGFGSSARGITVATRLSAQVIAPFDGRVAFAGPFRNRGRVLIIEHGGGYHTVLAGFERIDVVTGQWLLAGEPVGVMPKQNSAEAKDGPPLYIELRRNGQPVNPLTWITSGNIKVHG